VLPVDGRINCARPSWITGNAAERAFGQQWCNEQVTLSDADVAALAREAVDRRSLDLDIRIVPADPVDPYRWGTSAWTVRAGGASSYITADMSADAALAKLIADLGTT
jgi:hypothetical protein